VTLGRIYALQNKLNEAEECFKGALIYQHRLYGDSPPKAQTFLLMSNIYAGQGFHEEALRTYDAAMAILDKDEQARGQIQPDQIAGLLISGTAIAGKDPSRSATLQQKMFNALQLPAGGVADRTIALASARLAAQQPALQDLIRSQQESQRLRDAARAQLAFEVSLPDEERGSIKEDALLAQIAGQDTRMSQLQQKIDKDFPAYSELSHPKPITLADTQKRLNDNEGMLLFALGNATSHVALVTKKGLFVAPLEAREAQIEQIIISLRKAFSTKDGKLQDYDLSLAYLLYQHLLQPFEPMLKGIDQLVLVQNGALGTLPFGMLVSEPAKDKTDYRKAAWLAKRFSTIEVPSVPAFMSLRGRAQNPTIASRPFFGIGNPAFKGVTEASLRGKSALATMGGTCRDDGPYPAEMLLALAPLPESATELQTIGKIFGASGSDVLLGQDANEENFRKAPLEQARVLYFATHALLPGELSCQSEPALTLSPPKTKATTRETDGLLEASEVASLKLNADLVVLSACNTGQTEKKLSGGALSGLAESFFYAGARSLLASHWQVPSSATAKLMTGLFERLKRGQAASTAKALRESQLALIEQGDSAHPFFWAAFTLIGDDSRPTAATPATAER
jgi:CHAT domain-containing protein